MEVMFNQDKPQERCEQGLWNHTGLSYMAETMRLLLKRAEPHKYWENGTNWEVEKEGLGPTHSSV